MSELERWTDEGAPEAIERLLRAAESEEPSAASLARTLTSLGIAAAVTSATSSAAAGAGAGATALTGAATHAKLSMLALSASLAKWIALGTTVGALAIAAYSVTGREATPPPAPSSPAVAARLPPGPRARPARPATLAPSTDTGPKADIDELGSAARPVGSGRTAGSNEAPSHAAGASARRAASGPMAAVPGASAGDRAGEPAEVVTVETLAEEIAGIDRARTLLAAGRYTAALAAVDDYERRFPRNHFAPEVLYLRMEASSRAGRAEEARRLARRLLANYPTSPQSEKAKRLLDQKIE